MVAPVLPVSGYKYGNAYVKNPYNEAKGNEWSGDIYSNYAIIGIIECILETKAKRKADLVLLEYIFLLECSMYS